MAHTTVLTRRVGFMCHSCQLAQPSHRAAPARRLFSIVTASLASRSAVAPRSSRRRPNLSERRTAATAIAPPKVIPPRATRKTTESPSLQDGIASQHMELGDPRPALTSLRQDISHITTSKTLPTTEHVYDLFDRILKFANLVVFGQPEQPTLDQDIDTASSSVLDDLDESASASAPRPKKYTVVSPASALPLSFRTKAADTLCEMAYQLVRDPKVIIHEEILDLYVRIQCLLGKPQYLPEIFHLYSHKPIPKQTGGGSIEYTRTQAWHPHYDVPRTLSDAALDAAIQVKDMPLAIAIIDTTVARPNHKLMRFYRKALPPLLAVASTPVIAYAGASWISTVQNVWDGDTAKYTALAGSVAYIGTLGTIGFVAMTTWNDHMERVVWQPGTGLWDRWIREDERLYFDRIALAWGFQEKWRRGEEQGDEWEALRETCGLRSMVLDKTDLMEGMQ
ncbi:hypothetical protein DV736_g4361, partial [Chaetothyriales sp. CBS 134916]